MRLTGPKRTIDRAKNLRATMSLPERLLWSALRKQKTGLRFRRQHPAGPYILDFYCDNAKLCVEVDDRSHDFRVARDAARDRWLAERGVRTVRVNAQEVLRNLDGVLQYIALQAPPARFARHLPPEGAELGTIPILIPDLSTGSSK